MQDFFSHIPHLYIQGSDTRRLQKFVQKTEGDLNRRGLKVIVCNQEDNSGENITALKVNKGNKGVDCLISTSQNIVSGRPSISLQKRGDEVALTFSSHFPEQGDHVERIYSWLEEENDKEELMGCVLIGGKSKRMGRPKHLLPLADGRVWLDKQVSIFQENTLNVVLSGKGEIPASLDLLPRIDDVEGAGGPMAGILAVMRSFPGVSFIFVACDMPDFNPLAIEWLKKKRKPGVWGIIPKNQQTGKLEPLLAYYNYRCVALFESLYAEGNCRLSDISTSSHILHPMLDDDVRAFWRNCNKPEDLTGKNED